MKRFSRVLFSLLLIIGMLLELAACGLPGSPESEAPEVADPEAAEETVEPTEAPYVEPTEPPYVVPEDLTLAISEVMPSNKSTLAVDGAFPDWVELKNTGSETIRLTDVYLCCGMDSAPIGDGELEPGAYALIYCDGSDEAGHVPFKIPKEGVTLSLRADPGYTFDEFVLPACVGDQSACRAEDGMILQTLNATPGYDNNAAGFEARQNGLVCSSPLQISEAMVYNAWTKDPKGETWDWVELKNVGTEAIDLADYYLSDNSSEPLAFQLPAQKLESGGYILIWCDGSDRGGVYAPFALSAQRDQLYLSRADGAVVDCAVLQNIPYGGSYGRMDGSNGFYYFTSPTPGAANVSGLRRVADKPVLLGQEGVFNDVESVTVELRAAGEIHYTTDGSVPTSDSPLYEGPITLSSTSVLRACNFEPDAIASDPLDLSFIINEHHTLPVVSLMADPTAILGPKGMYYDIKHEIEIPGAVEFFEEDGSFSIACGIKLHGAVSKRVSGKKSMKLCFRSRYDGELNYDLFGNGVTEFASILLRHPAEDRMSTLLRDILIHEMSEQCFPSLPALDHKFSVLYINGQYWGIYGIREAHSATHYANHYGYDVDTVSSWKQLWDPTTVVGKTCEFVLDNDMRNPDNYARACEHIDMDSLIAWTILQAWCGNTDCNPSNVRYYWSTEDNKLRYALSDLDLGMFSYDLFDVPLLGSITDGVRNNYDFNILPRMLMQNHDFQTRMAEMLANALRGGMSDENAAALLNSWREELSPEVPRDLARWFPAMDQNDAVSNWNYLVDQLCDFATRNGGRSRQIIDSFISHTSPRFTQEEIDYYFGDLLS